MRYSVLTPPSKEQDKVYFRWFVWISIIALTWPRNIHYQRHKDGNIIFYYGDYLFWIDPYYRHNSNKSSFAKLTTISNVFISLAKIIAAEIQKWPIWDRQTTQFQHGIQKLIAKILWVGIHYRLVVSTILWCGDVRHHQSYMIARLKCP